VAFEVYGRDKAALKPITKPVDDVFGMLHKPSIPVQSVSDMNKAIKSCMGTANNYH